MNKHLIVILKILAATAAFGYIAHEICVQVSSDALLQIPRLNIVPLVIAIALMPINWIVEAKKWQQLVKHLQPLLLGEAVKSVFMGLAASLITPNRIGDFAGRIVVLQAKNRLSGAMSVFVGSVAQMLAIALFGVVAMCFKPNLPNILNWVEQHYTFIVIVLIVLLIAAVLLYFFIDFFALQFRLKQFKWLEKFIQAAGYHTKQQLFIAIWLSVVRYIIFSFQFYLILQAMGISLSAQEAFCSIALMYCFVTILPSFALAEWGIRGSMALLFIVPLGGTATQIVATSIIVWIINVATPALLGCLLIVQKSPKA